MNTLGAIIFKSRLLSILYVPYVDPRIPRIVKFSGYGDLELRSRPHMHYHTSSLHA